MLEQAAHRLVLRVRTPSGAHHRGVVGSAEIEGTSALLVGDFRRHEAPPLAIGEAVRISLPGLHPDETTTFKARAIIRTEDRLRVRYHFEVGKAVAWVVSKFSDRRLAPRVQPYAQAPIRASIQAFDGKTRFPAAVKDISTTGIGLFVPIDHEPRLFSAWRVRVWLKFPPDDELAMEVVGSVRSRRFQGKAVRYGIDFDSAATDDFGDKQDVIHEYVVCCQAAAIHMFRRGAGAARKEREQLRERVADELDDGKPTLDDEPADEEFRAADELDRIASVWGDLSERVREAIVVLVDANGPASGAGPADGETG